MCTRHPCALLMCQWQKLQIHHHWNKQTLHSTMYVVQHCPNHQKTWLLHICERNFASYYKFVWTHQPLIALTNLCTIHGMMETQRLLEQNFYELWVLHNIERDVRVVKNITHFLSNFCFWLSSNHLVMKLVGRFECCYLWIYYNLPCCS